MTTPAVRPDRRHAATSEVGTPLRITRRTAGQRRHLARSLAGAAALEAAARLDETRGRERLEALLPGLRAALWSSPGWRRRLEAHAVSPDDLQELEDLAGFPLLDRRELAESWRDLPVIHGRDDLVVVESSGSTGRPLRIVRDEYDCLHMWAVLRFWTARLGIPLPRRPRVVLLCALPGRIEYSTRLPILDDGALHRLSTRRPGAADRLSRVRPAVVFTDPAGAHWLAAGTGVAEPRLILSSAQQLAPALRARLARAAAAPVLDYYSTTETGPIAWDCLAAPGRFHVLAPDVWVESVAGELAVTRLRPGPLPLVRYRTGDEGRVVRDECRCGYPGWSILGFSGRRACRFVTPGGASEDAWQLAWLFKHHRLDAFRLVQAAPARFRLEIAAAVVPPGLAAQLRQALERLGWHRPLIEVVPGAAPEVRGGKPEPFRCELPSAPGPPRLSA